MTIDLPWNWISFSGDGRFLTGRFHKGQHPGVVTGAGHPVKRYDGRIGEGQGRVVHHGKYGYALGGQSFKKIQQMDLVAEVEMG